MQTLDRYSENIILLQNLTLCKLKITKEFIEFGLDCIRRSLKCQTEECLLRLFKVIN